ncbi:MAG: type I-C CRISPR-associated protein Cas8c/Csd1 [Thiobacillaceae bacterium]|nr:type I-C CRISPR-associated protein Cas8c/Csd1 [Thiobacillaceae bacterium]MDW8324703.1 type I-C CRISPR-associated protein Cas8c/Csd1 [Burkholderiales bacterium]
MIDLLLKQAGASEPGFARKTVKWAITCTSEGRYTGVVQLGEGKGRVFERCPHLSQPELVGGKEARSHYLAEALATVVLHLEKNVKDEERNRFKQKHAWYVNRLLDSASVAPYLQAAAKVLSDQDILARIRDELMRAKAKPTDLAIVRVDDINPLERQDWYGWWREFRRGLAPSRDKTTQWRMRCVVTGACVEPAATHPKIKGLAGVGGLGTGDVLTGFDKAAFQSYGLEQSANAAMSEETATAYAETLNRLIAEKSVRLGGALAVYWFTGQDAPSQEDDVMSWFIEPPEQTAGAAERRARELLNAVRTGQRPDLAGSRFVSLLLSGAAGRVMVRDVMQGSFEELSAHTAAWFDHLAIVERDGGGLARAPKFMAIAASLVRDLKDLPSPWLQQLWHAAITGGRIPTATLAQAVTRTRLDILDERPANHARMGLIKAYLIRNQGDRHMQPYLNPDHPHAAYHCGRALALFARLQHAALGKVGAGVVQRYYTAAAQTPGLILGRLASNAKNHLNKLNEPLAAWYEGQLAEILARIRDHVPRTLTLEEQSLFALGYYQQLAHYRAGHKGLPVEVAEEALETEQPE